MAQIGSKGLPLSLRNMRSNEISLPAGATWLLPAGKLNVMPGPVTFVQYKDPVSQLWLPMPTGNGDYIPVESDGVNYRLANLTGCAVGGLVTNVGSGYTSAPTVTASAGGSVWRAITSVNAHRLNTTITITTAGAGYNYAPTLIIDPPPAGGIPATAICTISAGAINAVTVINQGAGYTATPRVQVVPDPRDTGPTTTAVLTAALTGAGTIGGVVCTDPGTAQTAVPTLSFNGGGGSSAAATAIMCFTATGFTVGAGGAAYGNAQPFGILTIGGIVAGTAAPTTPRFDKGIFPVRQAAIAGVSTAGGAIQTTGAVITDSGLFQAVPSGLVIAGGSGLATTVGQVTITVGGITDTSLVQFQ